MVEKVGSKQRGQSEVLGIVLLFALVITVSLAVVVVGATALSGVQSNTMTESAEVTMLELQSEIEQVGSNGASAEEVGFAQSGGARPPSEYAQGVGSKAGNAGKVSIAESGTMTVKVLNSSGSSVFGPKTLKLGKIVYDRDGQLVAYQGGGVFRKNPGSDSSTVVSPPNFQFQYRNGVPTLSMPITTVSGSTTGEEFSMTKSGSTSVFPTNSTNNPIGSGQVVSISVTGQYYRAWGEVFEAQTDGNITYKPGSNQVILTLTGPKISYSSGNGGGLMTSNIGTLKVQNDVSINSYDSDTHTATTSDISKSSNAPVYVRGVFKPGNEVTIDGFVHATGRMTYDSTGGNQNNNHIAGETITGGDPDDDTPTWINGKLEFRDIFSTKDDLSVAGNGGADDMRVVFEDDVYVGGDVIDNASGGVDERFRHVRIKGNLYVQGEVDIRDGSNVKVDGEIVAGGNIRLGSHVQYDSKSQFDDPPEPLNATIPSSSDVGAAISDMNSRTGPADEPDNEEKIEDPNQCTPECNLTSGVYRLEAISIGDSDKLVLNTSEGPIDIYVEDEAQNGNSIRMGVDSQIVVNGSNKATIYTQSGVLIEEGSEITTKPVLYDATKFELKVSPDAEVNINSGQSNPTSVTGLINGSHPSDGAEIQLDKYARVYGAVLGDTTGPSDSGLRNHVKIHIDEALLDSSERTMQITGNADDVAFLRIQQTKVKVDG